MREDILEQLRTFNCEINQRKLEIVIKREQRNCGGIYDQKGKGPLIVAEAGKRLWNDLNRIDCLHNVEYDEIVFIQLLSAYRMELQTQHCEGESDG